jgi:hypothetical protein
MEKVIDDQMATQVQYTYNHIQVQYIDTGKRITYYAMSPARINPRLMVIFVSRFVAVPSENAVQKQFKVSTHLCAIETCQLIGSNSVIYSTLSNVQARALKVNKNSVDFTELFGKEVIEDTITKKYKFSVGNQ